MNNVQAPVGGGPPPSSVHPTAVQAAYPSQTVVTQKQSIVQQPPITSPPQMIMNPVEMQPNVVYQQQVYPHTQISSSVSAQNLPLNLNQQTQFQHSVSIDDSLQNYAMKKLPPDLKQISER